MSTLNRRQLLTAMGLTGASLFLPSLYGRKAHSQAKPIKRLFIFVTQHGPVRDNWRMPRNNGGYGDWEYPLDDPNPDSFSPILRPLHPNRDKLLVIEGLSQASTLGDRAINNHNSSVLHMLTGAKMLDDETAGGPSVDQIIAKSDKVAVPGRIPSLELATMGLFLDGMVNSAAGQRTPVVDSPRAVFDRLFPGGRVDSGTQPTQPTERDLIRAKRSSVLDLVAREYEAIAPRLGRDDRARLDQHRELVRDLELRVTSLASLDCSAPNRPVDAGQQLESARQHIDLVAAAFACDLTRVATLQVAELDTREFGAPPGDMHQDVAHRDNTPDGREHLTNYYRVQAEVFNYLIDALARYDDGQGGTLLDSTAAVWLSELGTGNHEQDKIPVVLAGSCGGYFRTGRYISHAQSLPNPHEWDDEASVPIGKGHSHLLVSLMQAMGLPNNSIGMTQVTTRHGRSSTIDLTGPLPRLT